MESASAGVDFHVREPPIRPSASDMWFFSYLPWSLSGGLSAPLIPLLALALYPSIGPLGVAIIVAASDVSEIPLTIVWGNLSDSLRHRKWFMVFSFALTGVTLIAMPFSPSLQVYYLLNVIGGVFSAASAPIGTILLLETRAKRWWPRDVGLFGLVSGIGTAAGLGIGAAWMYFLAPAGSLSLGSTPALEALLILTGMLALIAAMIAAVSIHEPTTHVDRDDLDEHLHLGRGVVERLRGFRRRIVAIIRMAQGEPVPLPLREWVFLGSLFAVSFGSQMFYGTFVYFLASTNGASLSEAAVFLVFFASAFASTALFYSSGQVAERYSPKKVFVGSMLVRAALIPLFLVVTLPRFPLHLGETVWMVLLNGFMGVTWAFASTGSTIFLLRLLTGNANRGKALGLYNALSGFGGIAGTLIGGGLYFMTGVTTAYLIAAGVVLAGCLVLVPIRYHFIPYRQISRPLEPRGRPSLDSSHGLPPWEP